MHREILDIKDAPSLLCGYAHTGMSPHVHFGANISG